MDWLNEGDNAWPNVANNADCIKKTVTIGFWGDAKALKIMGGIMTLAVLLF